MDQNPDEGSKVKRGVSRFGQAPIEREMAGNVSPAESQAQSPQAGVAQPYAAAAQPYAGAAQPYAQTAAAAYPAAGVAQPIQAIPAMAGQPVAAVGRKKRASSRNSPVEVGIGPGQSR